MTALMDKRLLLVDGNSIINRAFFALMGRAMLTAPDGTPTGALNGFFSSILSVADEYKTSAICVLFDLKEPTFRHKISADYKATRKPMMPELQVQMPIAKELLDLMGISRMELAGYEADDLIGTLSLKGEQEGYEVFILSGDHDDYQLISDKVSVIMPQKGVPPRILYTLEKFVEENHVTPQAFIHVKALMGDSSDNIIGIEKIGPKTAFGLIEKYGSIDGVLENLDKLSPAQRTNIEKGRERLDLNLKLCEIDRHVPVTFGLDKMSYDGVNDSNKPKLAQRLKNLSLRSLIKRLGLDEVGSNVVEVEIKSGDDNSNEALIEARKFASEAKSIKLINSNSTLLSEFILASSIEEKPHVGINFFHSNGEDYIVFGKNGSRDFHFIRADEFPAEFSLNRIPAGYDYKDSSKKLKSQISGLVSIFDTFVCGSVLNLIEGRSRNFELLFEKTFGTSCPISFTKSKPSQISLFDNENETSSFEEEAILCAKRLYLNIQIAREQSRMIDNNSIHQLLYDIEFPLILSLDKMERIGMHVSRQELDSLHEEFSARLKELELMIYSLAGCNFNIASPKQLADVIYNKLDLKHGKKGKSGVYSTSADELNRLSSEHPVIPEILKYRALSKLDSTYCIGLRDKIESDGRIHTTFTQVLTNTGRLSSTEPNLQNIPVRTDEGGRIRKAFTAPEGRVLVDGDYSQIELRLLAHLSQDEAMIDAFTSGEDIHKRTASKVFGVPIEEVTSRMRSIAKTVNFSIIYGVSEYGLSSDLGISYHEAAKLIADYGVQFPKITSYLNFLKEKGERDGYVRTMFGRTRVLNELSSLNRNMKQFGLRAAMNTPIQGTAADIIKMSMNRVSEAFSKELPNALLVMQVHDELIVECDEKDAVLAKNLLKQEMENTVDLSVKLLTDVSIGRNWLEAK